MLVSFDASDVHSDQCAMHTRRKFWHTILIVMLQIFDNLHSNSPVDQTPLAMHGYYGDSATC